MLRPAASSLRPAAGALRSLSTYGTAKPATPATPTAAKPAAAQPAQPAAAGGGSLNTMDLSQFMASFGSGGGGAGVADDAKKKPKKRALKGLKRPQVSGMTGAVADTGDGYAPPVAPSLRGGGDDFREGMEQTTTASGEIVFKPFTKPKITGAVHLSGVTRDSKRFYRVVGVEPATGLEGVGWVVTLGGRRIETPSHNLLKLPTELLAQAIALEWDYQNEHVLPTNMPLTNMAVTALDHMSQWRQRAVDRMVATLHSDATCQRATEPFNLEKMQNKHWDPLVDWFNATAGQALRELGWDTRPVDLTADPADADDSDDSDGANDTPAAARDASADAPNAVVPAAAPQHPFYAGDRLRVRRGGNVRDTFRQPPQIERWVRQVLAQQSDWHLAVLAAVVDVSQSTVLALAVLAQQLTVEQAYQAAHCDELYQKKTYGVVKGWYGHGIDAENARHTLAAAATFLNLLHDTAVPTNAAAWLRLPEQVSAPATATAAPAADGAATAAASTATATRS